MFKKFAGNETTIIYSHPKLIHANLWRAMKISLKNELEIKTIKI